MITIKIDLEAYGLFRLAETRATATGEDYDTALKNVQNGLTTMREDGTLSHIRRRRLQPWERYTQQKLAFIKSREEKAAAEQPKTSIELSPFEIQSGFDRVRYAQMLIEQLPIDHDGRNTWLNLYGKQ